jgi:predicted NodU family carbamoyl transferase
MYILGIYDGHNATATLIKNGVVIASVSEERFNGKKNYIGFPYKSIDWLLQNAGIAGSDIDLVAIPRLWGVPVYQDSKVRKDSLLNIVSMMYAPFLTLRRYIGIMEYHFPSLHNVIWPLYSLAFMLFLNISQFQ